MQSIKQIMEEYRKTKNFKKMSEDAKELLEKGGLVQLPLGSYWRWIHPEWLAKALEEKIIAENEYSQFIPCSQVMITEELIGKRGKTAITKQIELLSLSKFNDFAERYQKFCFAKEKEFEQLTLSSN